MLRVADQKLFDWLQSIRWDNQYTTEIAALVGDPDVCVGLDSATGTWYLAQREHHLLRTYGNTGETQEVRVLPNVIQAWAKGGVPLLMQSADVARHLLSCRVDVADKLRPELQAKQEQAEQSKAASERDHRQAVIRDLRPLLRKLGDESGATYHRPTGPEARKISTAGLWRRGAGA